MDLNYNNGFVNPQLEEEDLSYYVASKQLVDQFVVEGHAVRACYLYAALTDIAKIENDPHLIAAAKRLFDNAVTKQMYITGGIGQTNMNEGFTHDFDLPNESNYCETCAGISLIFWAKRMLQLETNSQYSNVIERTLYNNTLGSLSLDGKAFYYRNELERWGKQVARAGRPSWFACACCPPNLARLILSLADYVAHIDESSRTLFVDQFIGSDLTGELGGQKFSIQQKANLPWEGAVEFHFEEVPAEFSFGVRLPDWSSSFTLSLKGTTLYESVDFTINQGYLVISKAINEGDKLALTLDMTAKLSYANVLVKQDAGKAAITRGPLVYCLEEIDNGNHLWQLVLDGNAELEVVKEEELNGLIRLNSTALRDFSLDQTLYSYHQPVQRKQAISAIPYYARYNRSVGELQVWHRCC